ncbi:RICIN domain-containing protein [Streptomyces acidiscabies]|uniref:RICIN domain-containing protein n=1 Tax=Streptomyces acidiscabies TaxID=42234 RepID=A0AAP6BHH9_9ACTN|nr:RICIN domain-containing protein [Streptomyces acidiscabies]MBP5934913.1 beta-xylosidase [Streptomyces sp. LBUM 1476]MBZ3917320.1 RICIN domain-containing protein [Streptomyces acidiscabies]MDX2964845.1 RICIN domain-containing protein [Streptomyces acidiscabies]MDX3023346.1 RICIN domain-containing protein [Streptomyces acidiscabies]MDX3796546.1 RICIN domain-containing protein [Streptomyces acidiscabies]
MPVPRTPLAATALATLLALALPAVPVRAADTTVTVDFATAGGAPTYRASGTLYGLTENGTLPPDHFYQDIKWKFMRAGGAQLDRPGGWAAGKYDRRWNSTLAQYRRTKSLGGTFVILPHDIWGADGTTTPTFPGDGGNWSSFDAFYNRLLTDIKAAGATDVQWDIWNEPDCSFFWGSGQPQYLEMWKRAYQKIRTAIPGAVIVGASTCGHPDPGNTWWNTYLDYVKANNVQPDIYSWHNLPGDPVADGNSLRAKLSARSMTTSRPFQVNEYAASNEQNPGRGGWYISRLERAGADGLRANWAGGANLHDFAARLLTKSGTQYLPLGEWFLYRYYGSQTGNIVKVTPGSNTDAVATKDNAARNAKILLGSNGNTGNVTVSLGRLDTTSLVENGRVRAIVQRVPNNGGGAVTGPVTVSDQQLTVNGNSASVNVPWTDAADGYTVTLLPPSNTTISTVAVVQHSGQCLDDTNLSTGDGTQYQQYPCEGGYQQMLDLKPVAGRANTYTVVDELSGKCLEVAGASTADGAAVQQYGCNGATNQMFTLRPVSALGNAKDYQLVAVHSGKCVDVSGVSTASGAKVNQWTCDAASALPGKRNQVWRLQGV